MWGNKAYKRFQCLHSLAVCSPLLQHTGNAQVNLQNMLSYDLEKVFLIVSSALPTETEGGRSSCPLQFSMQEL